MNLIPLLSISFGLALLFIAAVLWFQSPRQQECSQCKATVVQDYLWPMQRESVLCQDCAARVDRGCFHRKDSHRAKLDIL